MIYIQSGLYVSVRQLENGAAPLPLPLENGFSENNAYLVLGAFSLSESGEAYFVLSNDRNEIWFISNRHLRTYKIIENSPQFRIAISETVSDSD